MICILYRNPYARIPDEGISLTEDYVWTSIWFKMVYLWNWLSLFCHRLLLFRHTYLQLGGLGPSFLSYPSISGSVGRAIPTTSPQTSHDLVTEWTINPPLSSGLTINQSTGVIGGIATEALDAFFTVIASASSRGAANAELHSVDWGMRDWIVG